MRAALLFIIGAVLMVAPATKTAAQVPDNPVPLDDAITTHTVDETWACPKRADFDQYGMLVMNHHSGEAVSFLMEHKCVMLPANTAVKVDAIAGKRDSDHVCIRPRGSQYCLWTFEAHIKLEFER